VVSRLAQENNTIVLIDGQGADEVLAGYQHYFKSFQLDLLDKRKYWSAVRETTIFNGRLRRASRGFKDSARRFNARIPGVLMRESLFRFLKLLVWQE